VKNLKITPMGELKALQTEFDSVLGKVNTWALSREKELGELRSSHNAFLYAKNGISCGFPFIFRQDPTEATDFFSSPYRADHGIETKGKASQDQDG
jgi:hypothetical protein